MKDETIFKLAIAGTIVWGLVVVAFFGVCGYVAWHFISKFW